MNLFILDDVTYGLATYEYNISDSSIRKVVCLFVGLAYQGKDAYCV
jgi:hypothetical protein